MFAAEPQLRQRDWDGIARSVRLPVLLANAGTCLEKLYKRVLLPIEQRYECTL